MMLYPFQNSLKTIDQIVKISGMKKSTLTSIKHKNPEKTFTEIVDEYYPKLFTWKGIAKSLGLGINVFSYRVKKYGLEATLLDTDVSKHVRAIKSSHSMKDAELPQKNSEAAFAHLYEGLQRKGFEGDELDMEFLKRAASL